MEGNFISLESYMNHDQLTMNDFNIIYSPIAYDIFPVSNNFGLKSWTQNAHVSLFPYDLSSFNLSVTNENIYSNDITWPLSLDHTINSNQFSPLITKEYTMIPVIRLDHNDSWSSQETWKLIEVIMASRSAFQNIRRHPGLWSQFALQLSEKGFPRSADKCKNRWKVLVAKYKRCCREILQTNAPSKPTGRRSSNDPKSFEFFDAMNVLLESKFGFTGEGFVRKFKNGSVVCLATTSDTFSPAVKRSRARRSSFKYGDPWEEFGVSPDLHTRSD